MGLLRRLFDRDGPLLANAINAAADPNAFATASGTTVGVVTLTPLQTTGAQVLCSASDGNGPLTLTETMPAYVLVDSELILVGAADGSAVQRAQKGSTAATHAVEAKVWPVYELLAVFALPALTYGTAAWPTSIGTLPFANRNLVGADVWVANEIGAGPVATFFETTSLLPPAPVFGVGAGRLAGTVELSSVSFTTDQLGDATSQALTGTWTLYYYDELPGLPAMPQCDQAMWWQGNTAYVHSVTIGGTVYSVAEGTLSSNAIAVAIANQINAADPNCTAVVGGASSNEIVVSLRPGVAAAVTVSSSDGSAAATLTPLAMASGDTTLTLSAAGPGQVAQRIQLDQEVMLITAVSSDQKTYTVTRGMDGTTAAAHAGAAVYYLQSKSGTLAFPAGYFAASYVAGWTPVEGIIPLPDVRIASATLAMTNANGTGPAAAIALTHNTSDGIRTLAGGFINFQIWGFLAVDAVATPAVNVGAANSVRDVFATVGTSADAAVKLTINRNGAGWAWLTFASGTIVSNSVDGTTLAPLVDGDQLTLSITAVGSVYPGADLTVLIRL